jgi:hypothetical protein
MPPFVLESLMKSRAIVVALAILSMAGPALAAPRETSRAENPLPSPCPPGFRALENSSACVRVSGQVRGDAMMNSTRSRSTDGFSTSARGRVELDVRVPIDGVPLRGVIRVDGIAR